MKKNLKEKQPEKYKLKFPELPTWVWALPIASVFLLLVVFSFDGSDRPEYMDVKYKNTEVQQDPFVQTQEGVEVEKEFNQIEFISTFFTFPKILIFLLTGLATIIILNSARRRW